jgi:hypothetical protein
MTSTMGAGSLSTHSAYSMLAPYFGSATGSRTFALPDHRLPRRRW